MSWDKRDFAELTAIVMRLGTPAMLGAQPGLGAADDRQGEATMNGIGLSMLVDQDLSPDEADQRLHAIVSQLDP